MYDKYSVLRVETTINNPREFKVFKKSTVEDKPDKWVPMGKSISNLYRYAEVSKAANQRYLDAIALADIKGDCINEVEKLCMRIEKGNRIFSGFNPLSEETELLFGAVFNGGNHSAVFDRKYSSIQYPVFRICQVSGNFYTEY